LLLVPGGDAAKACQECVYEMCINVMQDWGMFCRERVRCFGSQYDNGEVCVNICEPQGFRRDGGGGPPRV
jgi:hypothetical protein